MVPATGESTAVSAAVGGWVLVAIPATVKGRELIVVVGVGLALTTFYHHGHCGWRSLYSSSEIGSKGGIGSSAASITAMKSSAGGCVVHTV